MLPWLLHAGERSIVISKKSMKHSNQATTKDMLVRVCGLYHVGVVCYNVLYASVASTPHCPIVQY